MRLPRDMSGEDLAGQLRRRYGYQHVRQRGSHMTLTESHSVTFRDRALAWARWAEWRTLPNTWRGAPRALGPRSSTGHRASVTIGRRGGSETPSGRSLHGRAAVRVRHEQGRGIGLRPALCYSRWVRQPWSNAGAHRRREALLGGSPRNVRRACDTWRACDTGVDNARTPETARKSRLPRAVAGRPGIRPGWPGAGEGAESR